MHLYKMMGVAAWAIMAAAFLTKLYSTPLRQRGILYCTLH